MPMYRIDLAYDGTGFRGWAKNRDVRSVQETLESALSTVLQTEVSLSVAGRTDAGVHARHQVASFEGPDSLDPEAVVPRVRSIVGPEISITSIAAAPDDFDARFSATGRSYRYFVDESPAHDPALAGIVWHFGEQLDLAAMNQAASAFVGPHDFASLCRTPDEGTTERTVDAAWWERTDEYWGRNLLVYSVDAKAFCHQMVRSMVALCVDVGRGRVEASAVPGILEAKDRNAARGVAPPHGLFLWDVRY